MKKKLFSEIPVLRGERITLRALTQSDVDGLRELMETAKVYRYEPTYLFEKKYKDPADTIEHLYKEGLKQSLFLGVFLGDDFAGLAEIYGYRPLLRKASVGYRLLPRYWGQGIATETLRLLREYLFGETDVEVLTASVMRGNKASARVLEKNGFACMRSNVLEDWGYPEYVVSDKWLLVGVASRLGYQF